MDSSLHNLTIRKFHEGLVKKEFRAKEVAEAYFARIKEKDGAIQSYLHLMEEDALKTAEAVDIALQEGEELPMLAGVPIAVKDAILIKDHPATSASKILEHYPAAYDAAVIEQLKAQRTVFLGKTNLDEFAMGTSTENSAFQKTHNPRDLERVPGGSSGGSAAAVAGGMAMAALGSDTGGSIRQPAAFSGIVGLRTTYGSVSRRGLIALASSLDQIGTFGRTVEDAALLFHGITGEDAQDATKASVDYGRELIEPDLGRARTFTIGIPEEYFIAGLDKEVEAAIRKTAEDFKQLGCSIRPVSLPHTKYAIACYYIILPAEASSNLARFDGVRYARQPGIAENIFAQRGAGFGPEPKRRIILGTFVLSSGYYDAYYKKAQEVRALVKQDFDRAFEHVDAILAPTTPGLPFKIGEKSDDPLALYLEDAFTLPVNLAGLPGLSVPVRGREDLLPIGFQLIGKHFREADILALGRLYEGEGPSV